MADLVKGVGAEGPVTVVRRKRDPKEASARGTKRKAASARIKAKRMGLAEAGTSQFYIAVYNASPEVRIDLIREGVPARDAKRIIRDLGVEQKTFFPALGLKTATVNRKVKHNDPLSSDESERLLGVAKLVGQLESIVSESGEIAGFDAASWISRWLREPLPVLGGAMPISFLDTMEGQALVSDALARMQSGTYA